MKVKCICNTGKNLSEVTILSGELRTTVYPLDLGREYVVYCMSMWRGALFYLIDSSESYPAELFKVVNPFLPVIWYFDFRKNKYFDFQKNKECEIREPIWGYKEMVFNRRHQIDLIEGEPEALKIFKRRKEEIDEYEELRKVIKA